MKWFTDDEWAGALLDDPNFFLNKWLGNKKAKGWTDKLCHFIRHLLITRGLRSLGMDSWSAFWISEFISMGYEITRMLAGKEKISLFDWLFDLFGSIVGTII